MAKAFMKKTKKGKLSANPKATQTKANPASHPFETWWVSVGVNEVMSGKGSRDMILLALEASNSSVSYLDFVKNNKSLRERVLNNDVEGACKLAFSA